MSAESWANLVAVIAIVAGVGGTVFTQVFQSRQEEKRTAGQRWLEERRVAYAAVLAAADRDITGFGYVLFVAHHQDWENFVLPTPDGHAEAGLEESGDAPGDSDLQTATSALELIAPRSIRELASGLQYEILDLGWQLTLARLARISPEQVRELSDSHDQLKVVRGQLADAMRADVSGTKERPAP